MGISFPLLPDFFSFNFVFQAHDKVLKGAGNQVIRVKYLLQCAGKLGVVLQNIGHFFAPLLLISLGQDGLWNQQTVLLHSRLQGLFLATNASFW